jgi:hypothetical protein
MDIHFHDASCGRLKDQNMRFKMVPAATRHDEGIGHNKKAKFPKIAHT